MNSLMNEVGAIATIPAARPSKPSTKLTAFIETKITKIVNNCPKELGRVVMPLIGNQRS